MIPAADNIVICFAHVAYQLHERFSALDAGINSFAVRDPETLARRVGEADVLVISGLWRDRLLDRAKRRRLIQSIGGGIDQFPRDELAKRGIRLASARSVNARAVAEHAMALMLALSRRLPEARDNQQMVSWMTKPNYQLLALQKSKTNKVHEYHGRPNQCQEILTPCSAPYRLHGY
jgi:D-2-hydroxyacid dehydrogenase (NADP+)